MKREYNQEFLFTKPSTQFKGFYLWQYQAQQ
jgi:hypothetical protein